MFVENQLTKKEQTKEDDSVNNVTGDDKMYSSGFSDEIKKIGIALESQDDFNENDEDRVVKIRNKANDLKLRAQDIGRPDIERANAVVERYKEALRWEWPALFGKTPTKIYIHIDLDSFYASVESLYKPEYKNIPIGVGSMLMLATCNYPARKYGIKAGMPGYMAKRLCPNLVIVPCNFERYNTHSDKVMTVLAAYSKNLEIYGIDEACLVFSDITLREAYETYNNDARIGRSLDEPLLVYKGFDFDSVIELVDKIKETVFRSTKLTVSAGISVCRGLAKYSCGVNKPNGMFFIKEDFDSHILHLPIDKINGIGKATKELLLRAFNIVTVGDLRNNLGLLFLLLPTKTFLNLFRLSHGLSIFDNKSTKYNAIDKSIGQSTSFRPTSCYKTINDILWYLSGNLSKKLKVKAQSATILTLTYKYANFKSFTKRKKVNAVLKSQIEIFNLSTLMLQEVWGKGEHQVFEVKDTLRLLGLSVSGLVSENDANLLTKFSNQGCIYSLRVCPVCQIEFIHEAQMVFESHVNICLNKKIKIEREEMGRLDWYFKKRSTVG